MNVHRMTFLAIALLFLMISPTVASSPGKGKPNRLAKSSNPYLRLHGHNPVDWYPWGPEALGRAKKEGKPIFLSVGYSTCYWCHVMEREVFSNEKIADMMNRWFISIKVDREERPDLDEVYMLATQLLTGGGGWPNSVFLTPDLKPFYAGTYFGPEPRHGRPGFPQVLTSLHEAWTDHRKEMETRSKKIFESMKQAREGGSHSHNTDEFPGPEYLGRVAQGLASSFDSQWGGFGPAPKFPSPSNLHVLLEHHRRSGSGESMAMLITTLDRMIRGGLFDQAGGGFHRYSTDRKWLVPHFEKMLYDNAFLAPLLAELSVSQGRPDFDRAARRTLDFVLRELTGPEGQFYSALDAETEGGKEGAFYVWDRPELDRVLGRDDSAFFAPIFGYDGSPSFEHTHHVLHLPASLEERARDLKWTRQALLKRVSTFEARLLAARSKRERPLTDTKVLTDWNGMMIRAMALAGKWLKEPRYVRAAEKAARFLLARSARKGRILQHTWIDGKSSIDAFLDDYAHLAGGFLALHQATGDSSWVDRAAGLVEEADERLWAKESGGYHNSVARGDLLLRSRDVQDGAIPSANAWMARCLVELSRLRPKGAYRQRAGDLLRSFTGILSHSPGAARELTVALSRFHRSPKRADQEQPWEAGETTVSTDARDSASPDATATAGPVTASLFVTAGSPSGAGRVQLALRLDIEEGWHINGAKPLQEFLIPTRITLDPGEAKAILVPFKMPEGKKVRLGFSEEELRVYDGRLWLRGALELEESGASRDSPMKLQIHFQACNDRVCQAPKVLDLPFKINRPSSVDAEGP